MVSDFVDAWLERHPGSLSAADQNDLRQFAGDVSRLLAKRSQLGDRLDEITLSGEADRPTVAVVFQPGWTKNVRWSFEWQLRDVDNDDARVNSLDTMLVDWLGNHVIQSLETSPGLPLWEPDADGVVRVNVNSDAFCEWPQENRALGSPFWVREEGRLMTWNRETRQLSPWVPPEGHPWRGLDA